MEACDERGHYVFSVGTFDEMKQLGMEKAEEIDGVLVYPEATNTLMLFAKEEFEEPAIQELFGLAESYPKQAKLKADITRYAHWGWLPIIGGLGYYILDWRKNKMEELVKIRREDKSP
jgi:hypothetical protein